MVAPPLLQELHRSLPKILRRAGSWGLLVAGDAWKKGIAMAADDDAGNRWGNNGKVAPCVCRAVLPLDPPANLPGTAAGLAGGGGRRWLCCPGTPGSGSARKVATKATRRDPLPCVCVGDLSGLPLCMCLLAEKAFTYMYPLTLAPPHCTLHTVK